MRSNRKLRKVSSALSFAVVAVFAGKSASGVTLTMYYGQDGSYANSNNGIYVSSNANLTSSVNDANGEKQFLTGAVTPVSVSQTGPTTITIPVGSYLSLALDAVLTGNANPDAGATNGYAAPLPNNLGLSELSTIVTSTDTNAQILTPLAKNNVQQSTFNGQPTFLGASVINTKVAPNSGGAAPQWTSLVSVADVQPNFSGNVGRNGFNTGGSTSVDPESGTGDVNELGQFSAASASYGNATDFVDAQIFQGLTPGVVTLTPSAVASGTAFWIDTSPGNPSSLQFATQTMSLAHGDVLNSMPSLVIDVTAVPEPMSCGLLAAGGAALLMRRRNHMVR